MLSLPNSPHPNPLESFSFINGLACHRRVTEVSPHRSQRRSPQHPRVLSSARLFRSVGSLLHLVTSVPRVARLPFKLQLHPPKSFRRIHQLQAQFPPLPPFVPAPDQHRIRHLIVQQIHHAQLLPHRKTLRHNRQAPLRAHVHGKTFRVQLATVFPPLHSQIHA